MGLCGGLAINSRSTQPYRVATLTAVRNRPANCPPALPWKLCGDHMVAFHAGHELSQRMNACVYISASLSLGPGGAGVSPPGHMTTHRMWGVHLQCQQQYGIPKSFFASWPPMLPFMETLFLEGEDDMKKDLLLVSASAVAALAPFSRRFSPSKKETVNPWKFLFSDWGHAV